MNKQYGGLALRNPEKYKAIISNKEKYTEAMNEMINNAVKIDCVSYTSLEGFIFIIKVNEVDAVFNGLDVDLNFEKPITTILLKFVMIHNSITSTKPSNDITFTIPPFAKPRFSGEPLVKVEPKAKVQGKPNIQRIHKRIASKQTFIKEIDIQYNIYKSTLAYNNIPICPAIIYNNIFTGTPKINQYLFNIRSKLRNLYGNDERNTALQIINQLIHLYNGKGIPDLGVIGMEFADGYKTLDSFIEANEIQKCEKCLSAVIVNIIRLFICCGTIHLDLHTKNIMINNELRKCLLIDFGVVKKMTDYGKYKDEFFTDEYYIVYEKSTKSPSIEVLNAYLYENLGSSYKYIGNGEQIFMQDYLYNIRDDDERCKKILKLFLLILICEREVNYLRMGEPITLMIDFLNMIGLKIKPGYNKRTMITFDKLFFDLNSLDDQTIILDDWISDDENVKPEYKFFFKNILLQVCETLKDYYKLQDFTVTDEAVVRIGLDPEETEKYQSETSKYVYGGYNVYGGYKRRMTKRLGTKRRRTKRRGAR